MATNAIYHWYDTGLFAGTMVLMDQTKQLTQQLEQLNEKLERQLSWKCIIARGLLYGVSTAIGATVIAGIVFSTLMWTIDTVEEVPLIGSAVESIEDASSAR